MKISTLLCSSPESQEEELTTAAAPPVEVLQPAVLSSSQEPSGLNLQLVPDNQRKRTHRLSAAQKQQRRQNEAYRSRVYNLTLDTNELRQQIQQLTEHRDLHITYMLLHGQHFQADVLKLSWALLDGLQAGKFGLSPSTGGIAIPNTLATRENSDLSGDVHQFVLQQGRSTFGNRTFEVKSIRVLAVVDGASTGENAGEIRRVCGAAGGCVVEVVAGLKGQITRDTLALMFPHVLDNEALVSMAIGRSISFTSRLLLYFNAQRRLVHQVAQADVVGAFNALLLDERDIAGDGAHEDAA